MKSIAIVAFALVAITIAAPVEQEAVKAGEIQSVPSVVATENLEVSNLKSELSEKPVPIVEKLPEVQEEKVPVTRSGFAQAYATSYVGKQNYPAQEVKDKIVSYDYTQDPEGSYRFRFLTESGIAREETGVLKQVLDSENQPQTILVVNGYYNYLKEDNTFGQITYTADENGYRAFGDAIPQAA